MILFNVKLPAAHAEYADRIKSLWDEGLLLQEIAAELRIHRNMAAKALKYWHTQRGLPTPSPHSRHIERRQQNCPPIHVRLADQAGLCSSKGCYWSKLPRSFCVIATWSPGC